LALHDLILYEIHVGTFTNEGTFEAIIPKLDYLKELGVTALDLMPVAQFPGSRNWGYDGVYPYAPQNSYGGTVGLKALVNACHNKGLAVILDVVYNHLGPEGNYLGSYGPYFTDRYKTPWGEAINFDGPHSDGVRDFFVQNALYWVTEYHMDGLRIDAIHGIFDFSATHFLKELAEAVHMRASELSRKLQVIAESDLNDSGVIRPPAKGGYGLDALWNDDFHHAVHALITGERVGYYEDFGNLEHLEKAMRDGYVYSGQHSSHRKRKHGNSSADLPLHRFVVFSQNHDQVGNRMSGDRLSSSQPLEKLKLAAALVILSPCIPLLFMGEEYGEPAPFQYFVSHSDTALIGAVREGRKKEFASFCWQGDIPDPQAESTFLGSRINVDLHGSGRHAVLHRYYRQLIFLRKSIPALSRPDKGRPEVKRLEDKKILYFVSRSGDDVIFCIFCFHDEPQAFPLSLPGGEWDRILDTSDPAWGGDGGRTVLRIKLEGVPVTLSINPFSAVLYRKASGA
jgi:maltooligosyltrehalose trehalohydrolase